MKLKVELGVFLIFVATVLLVGLLVCIIFGAKGLIPYIVGILTGGFIGTAFYVHVMELNDD